MARSRWAPAVLLLSVAVLAGCTSSETGSTAVWTSTLERNGIELTSEAWPASNGDGIAGRVAIENVSGGTKVWTSNSCQVPAEITIDLAGILDRGDDWEGRPGDFKAAALDGLLGNEEQRLGRYRVDLVSATGGMVGVGCDDIRLSNDLAAGERLEVSWAWDGGFAPGQGSPALPALVEATFPLETAADISVDLDVELDEVDDRTLTPGQVIDIALTDESVRAFVEAKWSGPPRLGFDRVYTDEFAWELTIFDLLTGRSAHVAVDPYSGEITFVEIR